MQLTVEKPYTGLTQHVQIYWRENGLTRSLKQPFVSCDPLGSSFLDEIQYRTKTQCSVGRNDLQLGHYLLQDLTREEGEWVLGQTDLLVRVTQLDLCVCVCVCVHVRV